MPLTPCLECNRLISDSAFRCPGCSTREPFGVVCELCGKRLRRLEGVTSVRRETEVYRDDWGGWHGRREVDRDIVAHKDCLERYYTPPATLECSDCGLRLASSDLKFTALMLWSAGRGTSHDYSCPRCGAHLSLGSVQCQWAFGSPLKSRPCMKPLYSFQVGSNGQGHGHTTLAEEKRAEAEQKRASQEETRKQDIKIWALIGMVSGGLLGFVVGFFRSCSHYPQQFSVDAGAWFGALLLCAVIGAVIGLIVGNIIEA